MAGRIIFEAGKKAAEQVAKNPAVKKTVAKAGKEVVDAIKGGIIYDVVKEAVTGGNKPPPQPQRPNVPRPPGRDPKQSYPEE